MVKVGIIGSGFGLYGLLPAFHSTKNCRVVSICGSKTERLVNYCKSISLKNIYTDWQEMLDKEELDAIAIAVTPNAQYEIAKTAIKKNLHVFAEKPLAATYKQAKELLDLVEENKVKHMVDFLFPEIEEWQEVKKILDKKTYGDLEQICLSWNFLSYDIKNKKSSWKTDIPQGGGALAFYFSHSLYYLEYFGGKILDLKSMLSYSEESKNGGEVGVDLLLKFKGNVSGNAHLCSNTRGLNKHQLIFICKKATIVLENKNSITSNFTVTIFTGNETEKLILPKLINIPDKNEDERVRIVGKLTSKFIDSIIHNKKLMPSFKEGVRVQQLVEKIRNENIG